MSAAVFFNILDDTPSGPLDLETSRDSKMPQIADSSQSNSSGQLSQGRLNWMQSLSDRGSVHWLKHLEKNEFNIFAFSVPELASSDSVTRVRIVLCFLLRYFTVRQKSLGFLGLSLLRYADFALRNSLTNLFLIINDFVFRKIYRFLSSPKQEISSLHRCNKLFGKPW